MSNLRPHETDYQIITSCQLRTYSPWCKVAFQQENLFYHRPFSPSLLQISLSFSWLSSAHDQKTTTAQLRGKINPDSTRADHTSPPLNISLPSHTCAALILLKINRLALISAVSFDTQSLLSAILHIYAAHLNLSTLRQIC